MNIDNDNSFEWTDALVAEFTTWSLSQSPTMQGRYTDIEQFKEKKLKEQIIEQPITVLQIAGGNDCKNGSFAYTIVTSSQLPTEKYHAIKQAIESFLNKPEWEYNPDVKVESLNEYAHRVLKNKTLPKQSEPIVQQPLASTNNLMSFNTDNFSPSVENKKEKVSVFIALDGVSIYELDKFYTVTDDWQVVWSDAFKGIHITPQVILRSYSTEEKAREYITLNKPCLSLKDVIECSTYGLDTGIERWKENPHFISLKEKVKQKPN